MKRNNHVKKKRKRISLTINIILGVLIMLSLFSCTVSWIGYSKFTDTLEAQYESYTINTAKTAAADLNASALDTELKDVSEGKDNFTFFREQEELKLLASNQGDLFFYTIMADDDYETVTFIHHAGDSDENTTFPDISTGDTQAVSDTDEKNNLKALYSGEKEIVTRVDRSSNWKEALLTVMIPLTAKDGSVTGILCAQKQMNLMVSARRSYLNRVAIADISFGLAALVLFVIFLKRNLLTPLHTISRETERFARENTLPETVLSEQILTRNEIGALAGHIDLMEVRTVTYTKNLLEAQAEKARMNSELDIASKIQTGMLPNIFPPFPNCREIDIYASMKPAKDIGGDFYDFFFIDPYHLAMVMGDVSGKGVPAALFMMAAKILIKDRAMLGGTPAEILASANNTACETNQAELFVTVWMGILDIRTGEVTTANAGHEYPAIRHEDGVFSLFKDKHGFVIGGMPDMNYKNETFTLPAGGSIFIYTDGVTEATNKEQELFGTDRMLAALNEAPQSDPDQILKNMTESIDAFVGNAGQFDDITMLCVRYNGKDGAK